MTRIRLEKPLRHEVRPFKARAWYTAREAAIRIGKSPRRVRELVEVRPLAAKREPTPGGGRPTLVIAACCVEAEAVGEMCECGGRAA
jgi:hypothetical protein